MNGSAKVLTEVGAAKSSVEVESSLNFDDAFLLHHRTVYRTAYGLVRDAGLAEDVTQEVFLRLYRHLDAAPRDEGLRPWLLRVAINCAHNAVRGRSRAHAREDAFASEEIVRGGPGAAGPDEEYERQALIDETRRALDKIKEPMRSCLLLQQQGLSYQEIAGALDLNSASVGSLIARGRKEFVRVYGKIGRGGRV